MAVDFRRDRRIPGLPLVARCQHLQTPPHERARGNRWLLECFRHSGYIIIFNQLPALWHHRVRSHPLLNGSNRRPVGRVNDLGGKFWNGHFDLTNPFRRRFVPCIKIARELRQ